MVVGTHRTMTGDVVERKVMIGEAEEIIQQTISTNSHNNHNNHIKNLIKTVMSLTTKITTIETKTKTIIKKIKTNRLTYLTTRIIQYQYHNMIKNGIKEDIVLKCNLMVAKL